MVIQTKDIKIPVTVKAKMSDSDENARQMNEATNSEVKVDSSEDTVTPAPEDAMKSLLASVQEQQTFPQEADEDEIQEAPGQDVQEEEDEVEEDLYKDDEDVEEKPSDEEREVGEPKNVDDSDSIEEEEEDDESEEKVEIGENNGEQEELEDKQHETGDSGKESTNQNTVENTGSSSSDLDDVKPSSTELYSNSENIHHDLLQKQAKYIMDSDMLNLQQFQELSQEDRITALINMLNSNPETAIPMSDDFETYGHEQESEQLHQAENEKSQRPDLNSPMNTIERERYSVYLHGENKITEMHDIPPKSRLFIGNLPLKNVSKEDLFRIFSPYGHILQINIKNAFGFIQYDNPQSVREAIESESQELNFNKKLILEISSSNARPQFDHGDHGTNSSSTFISSSKRPFQGEDADSADMYNDNNQGYKKSKRRTPACAIYVKRTADRGYANEVFNHFRRGTDLETDMIFLKPRMELRRMINEVAYEGVWGVILVNKTRNVDIQTFYKGPQGETKFDEYISISADDAVAIFNNLKSTRGSGNPASVPPMTAANPYVQQQAQLPQPQPPQQQGYYGGYGMPPPIAQHAPPPPQQPPYVQQGYGMPIQNQGYVAPLPPVGQPYGRYQGSPTAMVEPTLTQPQLTSLLGGNGGQMNQQQLLAAIQNLPPNVVSNLLSMAQQQQQQQQQPQTQQQLLNLLQSMQGQQAPQQQQSPGYPPMGQSGPSMNDNFASQHSSLNSAPPQQQQQQQPSAGNNVQSLLDSLAKLQK